MRTIHARAAPLAAASELTLTLDFDRRQHARQRVTLSSGEEAALALPRGEVLRDGDCLLADDGSIITVKAAPERVLHVACIDSLALARTAYHLGNRHVPVQIGDGWLRIGVDHVLGAMVRGLGALTNEIEAPFEPESGAYASAMGETHQHGDAGHSHGPGRIHEHGSHTHGHGDHGHGDHGHDDHGHDH